ncbi:MAG TPA: Uma2 family endonuclease [Gemmataceae bacterium]|nr:Uma2 family endonuclease [Gemmataceae bacterium]
MTAAAERRTGQKKGRRPTPSADDEPIDYPYSDGAPLGESEPHMQCIRWLLDAVEDALQGREEISIHGDMFWYWREGRPRANRAPDVMVLFGVPMDPTRLSYKSWEHGGIVPAVIIETASAKQESQLLGAIKRDYERQGVKEYFVFDWSRHYLKQPLYGFRLAARKYQEILPGADGCLMSEQLGVKMRDEARMLRLVDALTNSPIPTRSERLGMQQRQLAKREAELARQAAEIERTRELLRKAGINPDAKP